MSKLLEQAFREAAKLTDKDQWALGAWLLEDLATGRRWDKALASSPTLLTTLADEALEEHRQGGTEPLTPGALRTPTRRGAFASSSLSCPEQSSAKRARTWPSPNARLRLCTSTWSPHSHQPQAEIRAGLWESLDLL